MNVTWNAVRERLEKACQDAGGQKAFAEQFGFSPAYVHDVLNGRRTPANRILAALGLERVVVVRRKRKRNSN